MLGQKGATSAQFKTTQNNPTRVGELLCHPLLWMDVLDGARSQYTQSMFSKAVCIQSVGRPPRSYLAMKVVARSLCASSANAALAGFKSGNQNKLTGTATFVHLLKCGCMLTAAAAEQMFNDNQ